eukprot:852400-Rhodomonas_salina.1
MCIRDRLQVQPGQFDHPSCCFANAGLRKHRVVELLRENARQEQGLVFEVDVSMGNEDGWQTRDPRRRGSGLLIRGLMTDEERVEIPLMSELYYYYH